MRFRSIGVSASNLRDYLKSLKEVEDNYIDESILTHIGFISLEETNINDELLGPNSLYRVTKLKIQKRKKRRKIFKIHYYRKKLFFYHQTKIDENNNEINN